MTFTHPNDVPRDQWRDGGPAFPRPYSQDEFGDYARPVHDQDGMSLRDWFAGQVLTRLADIYNGQAVDPDGAAKTAYQYADAMLKARDQ